MWTLLTALVTGGLDTFRQVRKNKADEIVAKTQRAVSGDKSAATLDNQSIAQRGWKDEYLLLITTAPLILCFLPDYSHYVELGFESLKKVPEYYWYGLGMVYIDTFGFRQMLRMAFEQWLSKRVVL